jgi:hydrogenase-4 component B
LLFFTAGNIYQQTHTRNIGHLGGLIKKMPLTAVLFLTGAMALGGLPPLNGFVSEFIIYTGLFKGLLGFQGISQSIILILTITGLVIVGGMSLITFTKTFGIIFLGNPRREPDNKPQEASFLMLLPQYFIVGAMLSVAFMPQFFFSHACKVVTSTFGIEPAAGVISIPPLIGNIAGIGKVSMVFIIVALSVLGIRWWFVRKQKSISYETWGCGYVAPIIKAQYSGQSFTRSFGLLFSFLIKENSNSEKIREKSMYPAKYSFSVNYIDMLEKYFVSPLAKRLTFTLNYFQFIQNGHIQFYVLYGLFFIILVFLGTAFSLIY